MLPALLAGLLLLLPSAAQADVLTFGSDLTHTANVVESHGGDTAFWNTALAGGQRVKAPADGQVTEIRVKGGALRHPNTERDALARMIHFQVLMPQSDGRVKVWLSSGAFYLPFADNPNVVSVYRPVNLCIHKGDFVDLNTIGGNEFHYPPYDGTPLRVFSSVGGSTYNWYEKSNGTNNGDVFPGAPRAGRELLMQMVMGSGQHAVEGCPGGWAGRQYQGVKIYPDVPVTKRARVRVACPYPTRNSCEGKLRLELDGIGQVGSASFDIGRGYTKHVEVKLSRKALVAAAVAGGRLNVRAIADAHDDHGQGMRNVQSVKLEMKGRLATAGNDTMTGRPASDVLCGFLGDDSIKGGRGNDVVYGDMCGDQRTPADGNDRLFGGAGKDKLYGSGGRNTYSGGSGNDRINSRNGISETVNCGRGRDTAIGDRGDRYRGCERVKKT